MVASVVYKALQLMFNGDEEQFIMRNILLFSKAITLLLIIANIYTLANPVKQNQDRAIKRISRRSAVSAPSPSARVLNGTYIGVHSASYNQDFFLGIPYAQPPTNDLRFRIPQSLNSIFNGTKFANAYSPECVGYGVIANLARILSHTNYI